MFKDEDEQGAMNTTLWPLNELERVLACPVCNSTSRSVLYSNLVDNVFFVAPGYWSLYLCNKCRSAYLDPRPDKASIGKAYAAYYTHDAGDGQAVLESISVFRRLRRMLGNGYLNYKYGTPRKLSSGFGIFFATIFPRQRQVMDIGFRYLPKPTTGQRLLDIGCGNGDFLINAQEAGWSVLGLEPDSIAVATALNRGLDVRLGTINTLKNESSCFDVITLSHVIEHCHEPRLLMNDINRLLKPGGIVFIDTPNLEGDGSTLFGRNWRGIEAPRHLVLFNKDSLIKLLSEFGFENIKIMRRTEVLQGMHVCSHKIATGYAPHGSDPVTLGLWTRLKLYPSFIKTNRLEFITLTASKRGI